jgi:hypothetical protein
MAKAVFTSKKVKKISFKQSFTLQASFSAILTWFAKDFFMGNSP